MQSFLSRSRILPAGSRRRRETKRFLKFAIVGALGAVTDFTLLNVLVKLAGFQPIVANGISFSEGNCGVPGSWIRVRSAASLNWLFLDGVTLRHESWAVNQA